MSTITAAEPTDHAIEPSTGIPAKADAAPTRYGFRRSMVANWRELLPGDTVVLVAGNKDCIEGTIDAVTKDGAFLWLRQGHGRDRQLFYRSDGYKILVDPRSA